MKATPTEDVSVRPGEAHQKETGSTELRVSTIELFFDLVFVFAITQLTSLLASQPTVAGLGRVVLIFGNLWWIYGGYAWLTNAVPPRASLLRLLMLLGMGGFLVVALAIPTAFAGSGVLFGFGYLLVTLVHTGMFLLSSRESAVRAMRRLGPANAITAALLLLAGSPEVRSSGPCGRRPSGCTGSRRSSRRCRGFPSGPLTSSSVTGLSC